MDRYVESGETLAGSARVLKLAHYYWAYGITVSPQLTLDFHEFEIGVSSRTSVFEGIPKFRDQDETLITNPLRGRDLYSRNKIWASYGLPFDFAKLAVSLENTTRTGTINSFTTQLFETTALGSLIVTF